MCQFLQALKSMSFDSMKYSSHVRGEHDFLNFVYIFGTGVGSVDSVLVWFGNFFPSCVGISSVR